MSDRESPKDPDEPAREGTEEVAEESAADGDAAGAGADRAPDGPAPARRSRRRPGSEARREADEDAADPEPEKPKLPRPNYVFLVITSVVFLALDLLSKEWAVKRLACAQACEPAYACDVAQNPPVCVLAVARPDQHVVVVENFFHFDLAKNKGGAWGLLGDQPDSIRLPFFFIISALAVVFIVSLYRKLEPRQVALKWALPLVLGGALGNLVDRVRHQHVIDFIDWFVGDSHWPTFNIADVWIVAGVILMVADMFTPRRPVRKRRAPGVAEEEAAAVPSERREGA